MTDYLQRIKMIVNTLFTMGETISYHEHMEAILDKLLEEYDPIMPII